MSTQAVDDLVDFPFCDVELKRENGRVRVVPGDEWPKTSAEGTPFYPSSTRDVKAPADLDNARRQFPERSTDEWIKLFDRAPHVMHQLLGDIFRETKAEAEREAGRAKTGRRPKAIAGSLDELHDMITPKYSMEPFGEAVQELIDKSPSLRAFARKVPMNHHTLRRMMRGDMALEKWRLEAIAMAGKVSPAYFREYREQVLVDFVGRVLEAKPNLSIRWLGLIRRVR